MKRYYGLEKHYVDGRVYRFGRSNAFKIKGLWFHHVCCGERVFSEKEANAMIDNEYYSLTDNFYGADQLGCSFIIYASSMNIVHCVPFFPNAKGEGSYTISIKDFAPETLDYRGWPLE